MEPNAFIGKKEQPNDEDLAQALGPTKAIWDGLIADLASEYGVDVQEWRCYSSKSGWSLRLKRKKRTIVWLVPCEGCFRVMFILGNKAMQAAQGVALSAAAVRALDEAEKYSEGFGVRLMIKSPRDLAAVKKLTVVKLEN